MTFITIGSVHLMLFYKVMLISLVQVQIYFLSVVSVVNYCKRSLDESFCYVCCWPLWSLHIILPNIIDVMNKKKKKKPKRMAACLIMQARRKNTSFQSIEIAQVVVRKLELMSCIAIFFLLVASPLEMSRRCFQHLAPSLQFIFSLSHKIKLQDEW